MPMSRARQVVCVFKHCVYKEENLKGEKKMFKKKKTHKTKL